MDTSYLNRRLATAPADTTPEVLSAFVTAPDEQTSYHRAKLALIARGKTPGHVVHAEDQGDGTFEVLFTNRPLRPDQSFINGTRVGNAGSKADAVGSRQ